MRQSEAVCEGKICGDYVYKVISALERIMLSGRKQSLESYTEDTFISSVSKDIMKNTRIIFSNSKNFLCLPLKNIIFQPSNFSWKH